jgi:FKBP-type peptidyl-prolyl cis-trans isomerase
MVKTNTKSVIMKKVGWFLAMVIAIVTISSCLKSTDPEEEERQLISDFITNNNITTPPTASGLYYIPQDTGTGIQPVEGDTVWINFVASYLNLQIFDTNIEEVAKADPNPYFYDPEKVYEPFEFVLGDSTVMKGIDEAVGYMKVGGNATLIIPSSLSGTYYTPLLYYIELVEASPGS